MGGQHNLLAIGHPEQKSSISEDSDQGSKIKRKGGLKTKAKNGH